jgi:carbon storage regulator CsrA
MLVLSRRVDEKILLPTIPVMIKVISAQGGVVRLGIEAPTTVPIVREELTRNDDANKNPPVRHRLGQLVESLEQLRAQLGNTDPRVRLTLEGIEEELAALKKQVATEATEREAVLVSGASS